MLPCSGVGTDVVTAIAAWRPRTFPDPAAGFAREVVAGAGPVSVVRARSLLWACASLASFGINVGLEPTAGVLLHPSVIERFVTVGMAGTPTARRRTVRTNLRFVARRAGVAMAPDPLVFGRSRAKTPYTNAELDAFLALADAQPSITRRMRLSALVCLGAGAGLTGADMRVVRGVHVQRRHGGMLVVVEGRRARIVPVLVGYHDRLWRSAGFASDSYLTGGVSPARHNVTSPVVGHLCGGADLPRIELGRLRASWLSTQAAALGLPELFAAAGFSHSQHVGDVVARLAVGDEAAMVGLLGGVR